jgi:hypothetical protein
MSAAKAALSMQGTGGALWGRGFHTWVHGNAAGTFDNWAGLYVGDDVMSGSAAVTNAYGIYMDNVDVGATLNYSIYTNLGNVSFGDSLYIRNDNDKLLIGGEADLEIFHDGTTSYILNNTGSIILQNVGIGSILICNDVSELLGFYGSASPVARRAGAAQDAIATTGATQTTPWGYASEAQANAVVTLANELRAALVALNLIKGAA